MKLEDIDKLLGKATPGPWAYGLLIHHDHEVVASVVNCDGNCVANARLIAAAPTIIKELAERVRNMEEENERLRRSLKMYSPALEKHVKGPTHTEST